MEKHCISVIKRLYASSFTGNVMPRSCSVCGHDQTADITKALTAGDSIRDVATRFGATPASIGRHLRGCLRTERRTEKSGTDASPSVVRGASRFASLDPSTLIAGVALSVDEALDLLEHAKKAGDRRTALAALREARDGLALLMKAANVIGGDSGTTVIDNRKIVFQQLAELGVDGVRALLADVTENLEHSRHLRRALIP